jgi:polysaccharide pyruvyl transferase WcaK-like protein
VTIYVIGAYGHGNAGDDFIGLCASRYVRRCVEEEVMLSAGALWGDDDAVITQSRLDLAMSMTAGDTLLVAGGGIFNDAWSSGYIHYFGSLIALARIRGCRVIIAGIGVEPLQKRRSAAIVSVCRAVSTRVSVRDREAARALGLRPPVRVIPDIAWLAGVPSEVGLAMPAPSRREVITLTLAGEQEDSLDRRLHLLRELIPLLAKEFPKLPMELLAMQRAADEVHDDLSAMKELGDRFDLPVNAALSGVGAWHGLAGTALHVGWRLHGGILTALHGGANLLLSRSSKVEGQLRDFPGAWVVPESEARPDAIVNQARRVVRDRLVTRSQARDEARRRHKRVAIELRAALEMK